MKTIFQSNSFNQACTLVGACLGWYLGETDGLLIFLVAMVCVDYLTGLLRAFHDNELSSRIGRQGITKKFLIFIIIGLANLLDTYIFGGDNAVLRTATISFYASNEGLSILENIIQMGVPVPQRLKDAMKQIKDEEDDV